MKIVKPTNPPTMAVIVDTVIHDELVFNITPSHIEHTRIDLVWVSKGMVGVLIGTPELVGAAIPPAIKPGMRIVAKITIHPSVVHIYEDNIEEI